MSNVRWTSVCIILCLLFSCETERIIFKGPFHVRFTETALTQKESYSKIIKIEVHNAGPALKEDVSISYAISGSAREGVDYQIVGTRGTIIIPGGEYFGFIEVQLINNSNNILRSQDVIFSLVSVNTGKLDVGQGKAAIGGNFTLTILDDCILGGTYNGFQTTFSIPTKNITISSTDCVNYRLSNFNIDFFDSTDPLALNFIDNWDNTITIPEQEQEVFPPELATIKGFGSVNPVTREIFLTVIFLDFVGTPEVSFTLKPE